MPREGYITVSWLQVGYAAGVLVVAIAVSFVLRLGVEGGIVLGGVRTFLQLLLLGYVLDYVFAVQNAWLTSLIFFGMIIAGAANAYFIAAPRDGRTFWVFTGVLIGVFVLVALPIGKWIVVAKPWYHPQYIIPFGGMLIGNAVTAGLLAQRSLHKSLRDNRLVVETKLALGASSLKAAYSELTEAVKTAMLPTVTSMMMVGLVHIPGIFGGQVLAGVPAMEAAKYQTVVMYMLAAGAALTAMAVAFLRLGEFFTARHQLRYDKLTGES